ncbi:MAG: O-antigen ligase family protein [Verrucomicrobiota bacterium JB024]|nr:O-antigen ligase family protein [Verrucomicrobiota bacterium JB024]
MIRNITIPRLIGFAAMASVWLNFTFLYMMISGVTGIPFKIVGVLFLAIMALYLMVNYKVTMTVLKKPQMAFFMIVFVCIPAVSVVIAPVLIFRFASYCVLCGMIFLTVIVWIQQEGWERFSKIIITSWMMGIIGVILSYFFPSFFENIAYMQADASAVGLGAWQDVRVAQENVGRAFGFYMQSNRACLALTVHLLILLPVFLHNKPTWRMIFLGVTFFAVLLTGSRGGFLYMVILTALLFFFEMRNGVRDRHGIQSGVGLLPRYLVLGILAVGALVLAETASANKSAKMDDKTAVERILSSFFGNDASLAEDSSVQARLMAQVQYVGSVLRSPIIGHGLGASDYQKFTGGLYLSSHNNILETAYSYGIPMTLAMYGFLIYLCFTPQTKHMRDFFRYNFSWITLMLMLAASFATNTLFDYRIFPVLMGFWLAMLYFPTSSNQPPFHR